MKHRSEFSFARYQLISINRKQSINYIARVKLTEHHSIQKGNMAVGFGITPQS